MGIEDKEIQKLIDKGRNNMIIGIASIIFVATISLIAIFA